MPSAQISFELYGTRYNKSHDVLVAELSIDFYSNIQREFSVGEHHRVTESKSKDHFYFFRGFIPKDDRKSFQYSSLF